MRAVLKCIAGACVMLACLAPLDACPGALEDAALYDDVRARADVKARLEELSKSEDVWVRQAAELALKPQDGEWEEAWR